MLEKTLDEFSGRKGPGLRYYRRKRPFDIEQDQDNSRIWAVIETDSNELLGQVEEIPTLPNDASKFKMHLPSVSGTKITKSANFESEVTRDDPTVWMVANRIWQNAHPIRYRFWLILQCIILITSWIIRASAMILSAGLSVLVLILLFLSFGFFEELRSVVQQEVLDYVQETNESTE